MKIINQNAIGVLFEKVEELEQQCKDGWQCIYFKIPDQQERAAHGLPNFDVSVVLHMVSEMKGCIYLCDNGEIFILYRGVCHSLTTRLSMYLWALYAEERAEGPIHQLFSLFDLSLQWAGFYRFCEKRYMEAIANMEELLMIPHMDTPLPPELMRNNPAAG